MLQFHAIMPVSLFAATALLMLGCAAQPTVLVDARTDRSGQTMGLDSRDFETAAGELVRQAVASGRLDNPKGRPYNLMLSRIVIDTMQRIDMDQLAKRFQIELVNSGKVIVVKSLIGDGNSLTADPELMGIRQLRNSQEFNQANIPGRNGLEAPDLRLTGKISQHINRIDATTQRIDYDFDLSIEDFNTGLALWQGTRTISKLGTNRTVTW